MMRRGVVTLRGCLALVGVLLALGVGAVRAVAAPEEAGTWLEFDSLDRPGDVPVRLRAHWLPVANATAPAGAVVVLHGCGGVYGRDGQLSARLRDYAALLHGQGLHALVVDSLTPRGERELCTQRIGTRRITQRQRRLDALAAIDWLAARADVDAARVGLLGWSHGGSTVLAAINLRHDAVARHARRPAFAVAFYPGCDAERWRGFAPSAPLLLLVGDADDWTPAEPCRQLALAAAAPQPEIEIYGGAHHGFDADVPVRHRADVPGGARPGQGVHVGGDPQARTRSRERLRDFLSRH